MIKQTIILFILLFSFCVSTSIAQRSAQATMRVSVQVISGSSVETVQPDILSFNGEEKLSLGMLILRGDNFLINNSSEVMLRNEDGVEVRMGIISQREKNTTGDESISYNAIATDLNGSDVYRGKLTTTVEYL